jgi:hypothetical protein
MTAVTEAPHSPDLPAETLGACRDRGEHDLMTGANDQDSPPGQRPGWLDRLAWLYCIGGLAGAYGADALGWTGGGIALGVVAGVLITGTLVSVVLHITGRDVEWNYGLFRRVGRPKTRPGRTSDDES